MNEQQLQKALKNYEKGGYPERRNIEIPFKILEQEHPIYLGEKKERCAFIDYIIRYNSKTYAVEAKSLFHPGGGISCFWEATKILAYTKILNIAENRKRHPCSPAILIPEEAINKKNVLASILLDIQLFSYSTGGDTGEKITIVDEFSKYAPYELTMLRLKWKEGKQNGIVK